MYWCCDLRRLKKMQVLIFEENFCVTNFSLCIRLKTVNAQNNVGAVTLHVFNISVLIFTQKEIINFILWAAVLHRVLSLLWSYMLSTSQCQLSVKKCNLDLCIYTKDYTTQKSVDIVISHALKTSVFIFKGNKILITN